jgi:pimeloyl-ACP methyl ester carboxylesterase
MTTTKQYSYLASNSYEQPNINIDYTSKTKQPEYIAPDGREYWVLANASNPATGYQGTIYQDRSTREIIVAHRGTDPKSAKDLQTDGQMLRGDNMQIADAMALTQKAQEIAMLLHKRHPKPEITVTGHSLGGALAQVTAYKYGLQGETFNAYGAIGLKGMPANGHSNRMTNHVIATDAVSSAAQHFGHVKVYARQSDLVTLAAWGYGSPLPDAPKKLASVSLGSAHSIKYFTASDSVLNDTQSQSRAYQFKDMIQAYRGDVYHNRDIIKGVFESMGPDAPRPPFQQTQDFYQQHNQNLNWGAAFGGYRSDATEQLSSPTLASIEATPAIDPVQAQLLARMAADPNFAQQVSQLMGGQTPSVVAAVTQDQADPAPAMRTEQTSVAMSNVPQQDAPAPAVTSDPIVMPPRIATLHNQITEKFGDQIAHLSDKDQQTAIALATHEATRNMARSVDYVWVNPEGKVCMAFDGDRGFSSEMNLKQVQNNEANQVLTASVGLQQTQQQDLAMPQSMTLAVA